MARRAPPPGRAPTGPAPPRPYHPLSVALPLPPPSLPHRWPNRTIWRWARCPHADLTAATIAASTSSCSSMRLSPTSTTPTRLSPTSYSPTATSSPALRALRRGGRHPLTR
uniref:Uncharacterized protein n=1 Tax=Triticum urartu TaxID=4572 RepID=A0A8R7QJ31_TRIUA